MLTCRPAPGANARSRDVTCTEAVDTTLRLLAFGEGRDVLELRPRQRHDLAVLDGFEGHRFVEYPVVAGRSALQVPRLGEVDRRDHPREIHLRVRHGSQERGVVD